MAGEKRRHPGESRRHPGESPWFPSRDGADAYTGPAGLKFVFDGVKTSVKGQYGQLSPNDSAVSGMTW